MAEAPQIVVVGAGAAGIGAGLELRARGIPFVILEAAPRVGGRAFTETTSLPVPWDQGCHWLHSADVNPLTDWADRLGARYLRERRIDHFLIWQGGGWVDAPQLREARARTVAAFAAIDAAADRGLDVPVSEVLPDAGRWTLPVRTIATLMASEEPERVSAAGFGDYRDTDCNWPVVSGYGDLVARMAAGLPVRLGVRVRGLEQGAGRIRVATSKGTLDAAGAIVTASTNVLISGAIEFGRGPAADALDLLQDVPCGAYEKVAITLDPMPFDATGKLFCMVDPGDGGWPVDFQVLSGASGILIAHIAGDTARELAAAGRDALVGFAVDRLVQAFGSAVRGKIRAAAATGWLHDPLIQGAYSNARPGTARRRHDLIDADTGSIAFAGEALSLHGQGTAHGAYRSGRDVAARLAGALG